MRRHPSRLQRVRPLAALAALVLAAVIPAGCDREAADGGPGAGGAAEGTPRRGGQVVIGISSDMGGINELLVPATVTTSEVVRRLFLTLGEEMPDFRTVAPRLAESWEFSDDRETITFRLRDDVVWSDGVPVTARDVEFTYRAWTDPDLAWTGAFTVEAVERVEVIDERTIAFHFSRAYASQLLDVATGAVILPAHAWGKLPFSEWRTNADWFRDNLVVDGPFTLASWAPQHEIVLERNPRYYEQGLPYLDRAIFRVVPDQTSQLTQLLNGELDFVFQLSPDDAARVEAAGDVRLVTYWGRGVIFVGWNLAKPAFADPRVRRALTFGIDRQTLVDSVWGRFARVIATPVLPGMWTGGDRFEPLPYDPDRARALLAEAGWEDRDGDGVREKDGRKLAFELITNTGNRQREDALVLIQDQLRRIGVAAEPQALEFNALVEKVQGGTFDAAITGWVIPTTFDYRFAYATSEIGGTNFIGYSNPRMDAVLAAMREAPDRAAMRPYVDELREIQQRDQPYTFLWQSQRVSGLRARVHGAEPNHLYSLFNLREWWVEPGR